MRDYALNRAVSFEQTGGTSLLARLWQNWKARRAIARMSRFDDYLLADIGVSREDVIWAAGLPLTRNPALALEERHFERRRPFVRRF